MRLSDTIESFIKQMMQEEREEVELKRNELAEYFHCAPSQINYVLATRFTPDHGYVTSSQRGGGGFIRIVRIQRSENDHIAYLLRQRIGDSLDEQSAVILCRQLAERGIVPADEARTMCSALSSAALSVPIPEDLKNVLRARIMKNMLLSIAQRNH
ncbi:MAG: CtsR family transcriptional regulator [Clostridiales bacterium]|nr:CtsR family transcriptional regulator [Clostridiales bacterium]